MKLLHNWDIHGLKIGDNRQPANILASEVADGAESHEGSFDGEDFLGLGWFPGGGIELEVVILEKMDEAFDPCCVAALEHCRLAVGIETAEVPFFFFRHAIIPPFLGCVLVDHGAYFDWEAEEEEVTVVSMSCDSEL